MININEVLETNNMIEKENLDVRTITIGISLLECIDSDLDALNEKIYNRITTVAKELVPTGQAIEREYGIPIVNKRISVTPIALVGGAACKTPEDFVTIAKTLDRAAKTLGINFIGGYSALVSKGMTEADELLIRSIKEQMRVEETAYEFEHEKSVVLLIGVNGVGKTTSVGKLAGQLKAQGKKVILAAADTFRAAAIEQLTEWSNRANVELIAGQEGGDPAAVVYDAVNAAKARKADVLICDTAGRLHNKKNLMEELRKINRIIDREYPEAHRETLVVLDGTTGQNALAQAKQFGEVADITGIILTKLDGTAKGGIAIAIQSEMHIPVKYIGIGEKIEDLQKFDADAFVDALFTTSEHME